MAGSSAGREVDAGRDLTAVRDFVERFAQVLVDAGMPRIASRIFVALLATDDGRLTAAELAERLSASAGAVSGGVRYLLQVGMISRRREPGSRRDHYLVEHDVWYQAISQRDQMLVRWSTTLREGAAVLGERSPAGARLGESVEFFEFLQRELGSISARWAAYRSERDGAEPDRPER